MALTLNQPVSDINAESAIRYSQKVAYTLCELAGTPEASERLAPIASVAEAGGLFADEVFVVYYFLHPSAFCVNMATSRSATCLPRGWYVTE